MSDQNTVAEPLVFPIKRVDDPDYFAEEATAREEHEKAIVEAKSDEQKKQAIRLSVLPEVHLRPRSKEEQMYVAKQAESAFVVPDVVGLEKPAAVAHIQGAGLKVGKLKSEYHDKQAKGTVLSTTPAGGTAAKEGDWVDLVFSYGVEHPKEVSPTAPSFANPRELNVPIQY